MKTMHHKKAMEHLEKAAKHHAMAKEHMGKVEGSKGIRGEEKQEGKVARMERKAAKV